MVDGLNQQHALGSCDLVPSRSEGFLSPEVKAERLDLYLKAIHAYRQFLHCVEPPDVQQEFFEKNGKETAKACLEGVAAGLGHACPEINLFVRQLAQVNSNKASQGFVERSLATGRLSETEPPVFSFREVQGDSLYEPLSRLGAAVSQTALAADQPETLVWQRILAKEQDRYGRKVEQAMLNHSFEV